MVHCWDLIKSHILNRFQGKRIQNGLEIGKLMRGGGSFENFIFFIIIWISECRTQICKNFLNISKKKNYNGIIRDHMECLNQNSIDLKSFNISKTLETNLQQQTCDWSYTTHTILWPIDMLSPHEANSSTKKITTDCQRQRIGCYLGSDLSNLQCSFPCPYSPELYSWPCFSYDN